MCHFVIFVPRRVPYDGHSLFLRPCHPIHATILTKKENRDLDGYSFIKHALGFGDSDGLVFPVNNFRAHLL